MKILVAGMFQYKLYESDFADALAELGHEVVRFEWSKYFASIFGKIEIHFNIAGLCSYIMNKKLERKIRIEKPNIVLIWRGTHIFSKTIQAIKANDARVTVVSYNNDDPFSPLYKNSTYYLKTLWRRFIQTIPFYDINFVFRPLNIAEYDNVGSKYTRLLMDCFNQKDISNLCHKTKHVYDVLFIGHAEENRIETIKFLLENRIDVKVYGRWEKANVRRLEKEEEIKPIYGAEYFNALNNAYISLCFFSRLNRDEYTTRSFEIPASKGLLLSERTDQMLNMFRENEEAVYFSSKEECLLKIRWLLENPEIRHKIALAGYQRVYGISAEIKDRAKQFINDIKEFESSRQ